MISEKIIQDRTHTSSDWNFNNTNPLNWESELDYDTKYPDTDLNPTGHI